MNIEELRELCLTMKGASECMPFDENTLVFKVMNKMFAFAPLIPREGSFFVNLKCDPERLAELREKYEGIVMGYHSDKKYWISLYIQSDVPEDLIKELVQHSVDEVIKKLPKKKQEEYKSGQDE